MRFLMLAGLLVMGGVVACSSVTMDPRKREFWVGGTVDSTDRSRLAQADSLELWSAANGEAYVACATKYAGAHASGSSAASEIADAAAASCVATLDSATNDRRAATELRILATHRSDVGATRTREAAEQDLAAIVAGYRERARQAAVKAVVDRRP